MRALRVVINVFALLWWLPTIAMLIGRLFWRGASWRARLAWVRVLRRSGHLEAAGRALERLEAKASAMKRRS